VRNVLTKSEEYRAKADECERLAAQTSDHNIKRQFLDIAHQWRAMPIMLSSMNDSPSVERFVIAAIDADDGVVRRSDPTSEAGKWTMLLAPVDRTVCT